MTGENFHRFLRCAARGCRRVQPGAGAGGRELSLRRGPAAPL